MSDENNMLMFRWREDLNKTKTTTITNKIKQTQQQKLET